MSEQPLWSLTAPPIAGGDDEPPARADVAIAGAGLTGLALARMLVVAGLAVVVVEARTIGAGTTGRTTGKLSLLQGDAYSRMREHAGDDVVRAYAEGQRVAQAWLRRAMGGVPDAMRTVPAVSYAVTTDGADALEREALALRLAGIVPRVVGDAETTGRLPFAPEAVLVLDGQSQLHPLRVLAELLRQVRAAGGRVVEDCRVTGADVALDGVRVATTRGTILAEHLVLATGAPVLDRGLLFARLQPSRSYVGAYRVPEEVALPEGVFLSVDEPSRSLRVEPDAEGRPLLLAGGGAHVPGRSEDTRALLEELDAWTAEHWPGARRRLWWGAQDYRSASAVPFAGELPHGGGRIWAATGYGGWGMTNAVASAVRVSSAMFGRSPAWADELAHHAAGWASIISAVRDNAEVAGRLVSGWTRAETARGDGPPAEGEGRVVADGVRPVAESTVNGVTCRVSGVCTHLGGVIAWNDAERSWDCPLHGSRFRPDGSLIEGPAVDDLPTADPDRG